MGETKHTPGPWLYRPQEWDDWGWVRAANGTTVAMARAGSCDDTAHRKAHTDPYEANARLIAAAPDLLEACKLYDATYASTQSHPTVSQEAAVINAVRAAIAKATGAA